jgi:hypothetical protein
MPICRQFELVPEVCAAKLSNIKFSAMVLQFPASTHKYPFYLIISKIATFKGKVYWYKFVFCISLQL